jgi:hypothetical protein
MQAQQQIQGVTVFLITDTHFAPICEHGAWGRVGALSSAGRR